MSNKSELIKKIKRCRTKKSALKILSQLTDKETVNHLRILIESDIIRLMDAEINSTQIEADKQIEYYKERSCSHCGMSEGLRDDIAYGC